MADEILALAGKLRVDAAQWSQGFKQAESATKGSATAIEGAFGKVSRAAQTAVRTMDEASARVAAASWASRRAAEQEAESRQMVAKVYRETGEEIKKHRTYEQAAATTKIKQLEAQGWAARRAADQEVEALRRVESQARRTGAELRQLGSSRQTAADYIRENNAIGGGSGGAQRSRGWTAPGYLTPRNPPRGGGGGLGGMLSGAGSLGMGGRIGSAVSSGAPALAVGSAVAFAVTQASQGEAAMNRLQSVIKATGGQAGRTAEQMGELATKIQQTTTFSDTAAIEAQTFLATLDGISGANFDEAVKSAADLASVMKIDLGSATEMVGKALQDPVNGLRSLSAAGIKFTDQQKEQIQTLLDSGNAMGAQRIVLDEIAARMGGSAASAAKTLSGRWQQLKNDADSLGQAIGEGIISPLEKLEKMDKAVGGAIASAIDPEAAKGLAGKFDDPAVRAARQRNEFLAAKDQESRSKHGIGLTAAEIAKQNSAYDNLSQEEREKWNIQTDAGAKFDMRGERDKKKLEAAAASGNAFAAQQLNAMETAGDIDARQQRGMDNVRAEREAIAAQQEAFRLNDPTERAKRAQAFAASSQGRETLGGFSSAQGKAYAGGLVTDVKALGASGKKDAATGMVTKETQTNIDATLAQYRAMFSAMPQFSEAAWKEIEADLQFNLRNAAIAVDEQKVLYLQSAEEVAKSAGEMFDAYDKKIEEARKKAEELAKRTVAPIDQSAIPGGLGKATYHQAQGVIGGLGRDVTETLKPDETGAIDNSQLGTILANYKAVLSQMPGYSDQVFGEIERQVVEHAKNAMESTGALREVYLQKMKETLAGAGGIVADKRQQVQGTSQADQTANYYGALGGLSQQDLGAQVRQRQDNVRTTAAIGIGTPEQKKGLTELAKLQADVMKQIRNSTGQTREANIAELKKLDEAWAKAYAAIRNGSKETVDQLTGDAAKQSQAYQDAAAKRGGGGGGGGKQFGSVGEMMAGINQMSQGLSSMFSNALSGLGNAGAAFGQYLNSITDPVERIDAQINDAKQKLKGAMMNARGFGAQGGTDFLTKQVKDLERQREETVQRQEAARKEAFRTDREAKLRKEADEASTTFLVGAKASTNLYGPGFRAATGDEKATPSVQNLTVSLVVNGAVKPEEILQMMDRAAKQAGVDKSGKSFLRSANGRT